VKVELEIQLAKYTKINQFFKHIRSKHSERLQIPQIIRV